MGYQREEGLRALELPGEVTYAFLPETPFAVRLANLAEALGREVILHLPMESATGKVLGPGGMTSSMSEEEFAAIFGRNLAAVPHIRGVSNHMGSLLTAQRKQMHWLMELLRERGKLFFLDSRTTPESVADDVAHSAGLASTRRDVFLDDEQQADTIRLQFRELVKRALEKGTALAIGHPHPETVTVLREELPRLAAKGIGLVSASTLIKIRSGEDARLRLATKALNIAPAN